MAGWMNQDGINTHPPQAMATLANVFGENRHCRRQPDKAIMTPNSLALAATTP
jgi:hypothetical protein